MEEWKRERERNGKKWKETVVKRDETEDDRENGCEKKEEGVLKRCKKKKFSKIHEHVLLEETEDVKV